MINEISLPGADESALSQLLSASSVASFGKDTEQVTDLRYRDAFKIDPDMMITSFYLSNTTILSDIESLMVPNRTIRAELHKLNLYRGPGGHFKSHVDTPRSGDMFGSLVVCLPTQFIGGALVIRHRGQEVVFDWSSSPSDPLNVICWAAFFCDVEHEILPVTSGHRLTLTYNLYSVKERLNAVPVGCSLCISLRELLNCPHFMREGGCLGFECKHSYAIHALTEKELLSHVLKGADYMVYSAAKSLGLAVTVKPVMEGEDCWYLLPTFSKRYAQYESEVEDEGSHSLSLNTLRSVFGKEPGIVSCGVSWCRPNTWKGIFECVSVPLHDQDSFTKARAKISERMLRKLIMRADGLRWMLQYNLKQAEVCKEDIPIIADAVKRFQRERYHRYPFGSFTYYGNDAASLGVYYQSAVVLVEVPRWGTFPRTVDMDCPGPSKKMKRESMIDSRRVLYWKK